MTLLLSRITMDPADRRLAHADAGDHHRMLMRALGTIPGDSAEGPRQRAGLLFREEESRGGRLLLVQSRIPLDGARLGHGYSLEATRDISRLLTALEEGRPVRYRVVAAPVKRLGKTDKPRELLDKSNKRLSSKAHTTPLRGRAAEDWWVRKAEENGLALQSLQAVELADAVDARKRGAPKPIRHPAVRFDGTAVIDAPDAVRHALLNGIGRGKNYGLGLLSLASGG